MTSHPGIPVHRQADSPTCSPANEVLAEIGWLLVIHLAVALAICLILDLCGVA